MPSCQCWNMKHKARCYRPATKRCTVCGERLCGGCATNHHVHETFESLDASRVRVEREKA